MKNPALLALPATALLLGLSSFTLGDRTTVSSNSYVAAFSRTGKMPVPQEKNLLFVEQASCLLLTGVPQAQKLLFVEQASCLFLTGKMPVPQAQKLLFVKQASCLLLTEVQDLSSHTLLAQIFKNGQDARSTSKKITFCGTGILPVAQRDAISQSYTLLSQSQPEPDRERRLGPHPPRIDFAAAAKQLGITEAELIEALGLPAKPPEPPTASNSPPCLPPPPPLDIPGAAKKLGVTEARLIQILGIPPRPPGDRNIPDNSEKR
jgi:hypothetical protein